MQIRKNAVFLPLSFLLFAPLAGCAWFNNFANSATSGNSGNSGTTSVNTAGPAGKVVQGAVSGATVWADSLSAGTRFVIDSNEQSTETTTDANGAFTLPATPSYKYVIVSQGGTDAITDKTANTLLAPGGAQSVSPLTTLVALDTTGNLANSIDALLPAGTSFDSDITASGGLTPAAMVLLTSFTTSVTALDATIQSAASKNSATLSQQQLNDINLTVYSQIASQFSTVSSASLSNTATLATNLQTALTTAITTVAANNPNVTVQNASTVAATVANNSVATAANVVGNATGNSSLANVTASNVQTTGVTANATTTVTESAVMSSGTNTQALNNTISSVTQAIGSSVTATSTPASYSPPTIAVINNPTIVGYKLLVTATGNEWNVSSFTITFSDDMVATISGGTNYAHSVLNPSNYQFTPSGCSPTSYSSDTVTFACADNLQPGSFQVEVLQATSTGGVWASATSEGLTVNNTKTFTLPTVTGATGGSSLTMF